MTNLYLHGTTVLGAVAEVEKAELMRRIDRKLVIGFFAGALSMTVGLPIVWSAHRIIGGLLGFFLLGPAVGVGTGWLLAREDIKKFMEDNAKQNTQKQGVLKRDQTPANVPSGVFSPF